MSDKSNASCDEVASAVETPVAQLPENAITVIEDLACAHCGYNLRGLSSTGRCPECFENVADSLRGNLLKYADAKWLRRLRFGTTLKLWNIVLAVGINVVSFVGALIGLPQGFTYHFWWIGAGFGLWATFVITSQEPRISLQEDPVSWRRAIRTSAVAAVAGQTFSGELSGGRFVEVAAVICDVVASLAPLVVVFGELRYLREFALRVPDAKLAESTRIVQWGATILLALASATHFIAATVFTRGAPTLQPGTGPTVFWSAGACVFGVAGLVFWFWYAMLLFDYRREFGGAATASADGAGDGAAGSR